MWTSEHTHTTTAPAAAVWERWARPERWPEHDPRVRRAELRGPAAVGSTISITPTGGPATVVEIVELEPLRRLATLSRLPGGTLRVVQQIDEQGPSAVLRHRIELSGLSTPLFRRLFVGSMAAGVPEVLAALARLAESDEHAERGG